MLPGYVHLYTHTRARVNSTPSLLPVHRDVHLELKDQKLGSMTGTLHFIKFATARMEGFMQMVNDNGLTDFSKGVCATGGGAYKYEKEFKEVRGRVKEGGMATVRVFRGEGESECKGGDGDGEGDETYSRRV